MPIRELDEMMEIKVKTVYNGSVFQQFAGEVLIMNYINV